MRDYLAFNNLKKSLSISAIVTILTMPRILAWGVNPFLYVPAAFFCMAMVGGAVTAWGQCAGMTGIMPPQKKKLSSLGIAVAAGLASSLICFLLLDPRLRPALQATGNEQFMHMNYPPDPIRRAALVLSEASFAALFIPAASMSFLARLTRNKWIAALGTLLLQWYITSSKIADNNVTNQVPLLYLSAMTSCALSCWIFARAGLLATGIFKATLAMHVFMW